jgi:hypothetical protein
MTPITRAKLLLLLLVPALAVPRGVVLGWCLCVEPTAPCCTSCCCEDETSGNDDCASCKSIEIEDFDELLSEGAPELPILQRIASLPASFQLDPAAALERTLGARAPPPVTPPGLRPGAAPLRL